MMTTSLMMMGRKQGEKNEIGAQKSGGAGQKDIDLMLACPDCCVASTGTGHLLRSCISLIHVPGIMQGQGNDSLGSCRERDVKRMEKRAKWREAGLPLCGPENAEGEEPASPGSARVSESEAGWVPANREQENGGDSIIAGTCPAVPLLKPLWVVCLWPPFLMGTAQTTEPIDADESKTTEPIDADESWMRPELDITRLKTDAAVEILSDGEWWYLAFFLTLATVGDSCRDWSLFPSLANLCVMSVLAGKTGRL